MKPARVSRKKDDAWTDADRLRWAIYWILIAVCLGNAVGRIFAVTAEHNRHPFLSANDRSRWATVRSLVDHQTFAIDEVIKDRYWDSIDKVYHLGPDGKYHYYSSKPPLMACVLAGEYWLIKNTVGIEISEHPYYVGRVILIVTNGLLLLGLLWPTIWIVERYARSDFAKIGIVATVALGTFLTTYAVTINNHLLAATSVAIALYCGLRVWCDGRGDARYLIGAGFFAACAAVNDLPAFSFFALLGLAMLIKRPMPTLLLGVPAAAVILGASLVTNYVAHQSWRPPYAHRSDGEVLGTLEEKLHGAFDRNEIPEPLTQVLAGHGIELSDQAEVITRDSGNRWVILDSGIDRRYAIQRTENSIEVRDWDNWYDYDTSYWKTGVKKGVDVGEKSIGRYAFHVVLGHHGILSLTPVWLLSILGIGLWLSEKGAFRQVAVFVLVLTLVCVLFYIFRPLKDRNYGGMTSGFRWAFWLIPMWLTAMIPVLDRWKNWAWGQRIFAALLLFSAVSASYSALNPWVHPWIYTYMGYLGWLE
ncbi:hypothetical protein ACYFX5_27060 [Bremerella sp. T1]|uniref:hypothetical protein n=1 Tax=Bremerella sp. TYQ1 TaxID=3119568 RepID=UPI001CCB12B1|nr:hypothetical protein [Bremerella volcania]UBM36670.1 hypothetical protein LA756_01910 [Bremerella volcania]